MIPTDFGSPFLRNAAEAFRKRSKSLGKRNQFSWDTEPDDFEWITFTLRSRVAPTLILQLSERNRASVFVRSQRNADRGKVFFRLEDLLLMDDGPRLVSVFEESHLLLHRCKSATDEKFDEMRRIWMGLELRPIG